MNKIKVFCSLLTCILIILCIIYFSQNDNRPVGEKISIIFGIYPEEKIETEQIRDINTDDLTKSSFEQKDGMDIYNSSVKVTTYDSKNNINPDKPFLINRLSKGFMQIDNTIDSQKIPFNECKSDLSYKVFDNDDLEIRNGCAAIFSFKNKIGYCKSNAEISDFGNIQKVINDTPIICNTNIQNSNSISSSNLTGFKDYNLELIKEYSDNKCKNETYGFDESNTHIYTDKGCKGLFKLGLLYGVCYSNGEYSKCGIGQTKKYDNFIESDEDILPTGSKYVGLLPLQLFPIHSSIKSKICKKTDYEFLDEKKFKVKNSCGIDNSLFTYKTSALDLYKGRCTPIYNNGICTIGEEERKNNLIFQAIPKSIKEDIEKKNKDFENKIIQLEGELDTSITTHTSFLSDVNNLLINYYKNIIRTKDNSDRITNKQNDFEIIYKNIININNNIIQLNKKKREYKKYCQTNSCPLINEFEINNYNKFNLYSKDIKWINFNNLKQYRVYDTIFINYIKPLKDYVIKKLGFELCTDANNFNCLKIDDSLNIVNIKCVESTTNPNEENCY